MNFSSSKWAGCLLYRSLPGLLGGSRQEQQQQLLRGLKSSIRRREGPPEKDDVQKAVADYTKRRQIGPRARWQVDAATWVKKMHADRGDVKVGVHAGNGRFIILDSLKPRYVVPDLSDCKLKPYVSKVGPEKPSSAAETSK